MHQSEQGYQTVAFAFAAAMSLLLFTLFANVLVVQFGVSAIGLPPFELPDGLAFAVAAAVLCPIGQLVASLVLPSTRAPASALRRLDSLLVLGPVWAWWAGIAAESAVGA